MSMRWSRPWPRATARPCCGKARRWQNSRLITTACSPRCCRCCTALRWRRPCRRRSRSRPLPPPLWIPPRGSAPAASAANAAVRSGTATGAEPAADFSRAATPAPSQGEAADWSRLIDALSLHGIARELAANCSLKARDGDVFHLMVAPAHASLRNPRLEQRLQEALAAHLGSAVKLVFTVAPTEAATPAVIKERVSQDRLRAAQDAIAQDSNVKTLQDLFEARVVPESVQPFD